jgi:hypothetical protein
MVERMVVVASVVALLNYWGYYHWCAVGTVVMHDVDLYSMEHCDVSCIVLDVSIVAIKKTMAMAVMAMGVFE